MNNILQGNKKLHGSYFRDGRKSFTFGTTATDTLTDVGFRLAHDKEDRAKCRGGAWENQPAGAVSGWSAFESPQDECCNLGFRLCVDWRET